MIISRKVVSSTTVAGLAVIAVWAARKYLGIDLTAEEAIGIVTVLVGLAGWTTREDARVAETLKLRGRHRQMTVGQLVEQRERDRTDGLYETSAYPAIER